MLRTRFNEAFRTTYAADTRIRGTTKKQIDKLFELAEREALLPLQLCVHAKAEPGRFRTSNDHIPKEKFSVVERGTKAMLERVKAAAFRDQRTLEDFGWDFNRSIKRKHVFDLAAGDFVRKHCDVLLVGTPGVGKSHIAQSMGLALIHSGYTVFYRSIFFDTCSTTKPSKVMIV